MLALEANFILHGSPEQEAAQHRDGTGGFSIHDSTLLVMGKATVKVETAPVYAFSNCCHAARLQSQLTCKFDGLQGRALMDRNPEYSEK